MTPAGSPKLACKTETSWKDLFVTGKGIFCEKHSPCKCAHAHAPREAAFWSAESFKSHRWLEKSASRSLWSQWKTRNIPSFIPRHWTTYISCGGSAQEVCVFVRVPLSRMSLWGSALERWKACQLVSEGFQREGLDWTDCCPRQLPNCPQCGSQLPPIEAEFIDEPFGFKSTELDVGLNCLLLCKLSFQDVLPLPPQIHPDPFCAAEQIASCCCLTDLRLL